MYIFIFFCSNVYECKSTNGVMIYTRKKMVPGMLFETSKQRELYRFIHVPSIL